MAKGRTRGGAFLHFWQGAGPKGQESTPLRHQKGQIEQDRFLNSYIDPKDGARTWSF